MFAFVRLFILRLKQWCLGGTRQRLTIKERRFPPLLVTDECLHALQTVGGAGAGVPDGKKRVRALCRAGLRYEEARAHVEYESAVGSFQRAETTDDLHDVYAEACQRTAFAMEDLEDARYEAPVYLAAISARLAYLYVWRASALGALEARPPYLADELRVQVLAHRAMWHARRPDPEHGDKGAGRSAPIH